MGEARRKKQTREQEQLMIRQGEQQLMERCGVGLVQGAKIRMVPPGELKMSEIIEEYAQPLLDVIDDREKQKHALMIAIALR